MKLHSIFISALLLTPGFATHAMEQAATPVDQKAQLQALILASDAQQFKDTWKTFQDTTHTDEMSTTQTALNQLATQLHTQKTAERAAKLKDKWGRIIAGASVIPTGALSFGAVIGYIWLSIDDFKKCQGFIPLIPKKYNGYIQILTPVIQKKFSDALEEIGWLALFTGISLYYARLAKNDIAHARFAGTQELTKEINALEEILTCLGNEPEQEPIV